MKISSTEILPTKLTRITVLKYMYTEVEHFHVATYYGVQLTWRDIEQTLYRLSLSFAVTGIDPILESLERVTAHL